MIVDIHGHITSPELFARFPMPPSLADIDGMLEQKSAAGIATTIVGSPVGAGTMVPLPGLDNYRQPLDQLQAFHDFVAETVRGRPDQLRAYAYLNPCGTDQEFAHAASRLRQDEFVGLIGNTSVRGGYLGSGAADAFFALAAETRAPVLLHPPAEPAGRANLRNIALIEHVVRPCDVTVAVADIILGGWLEKYPTLRLIAPTAGGALPMLREKLDLAHQRNAAPAGPRAARRSAGLDAPRCSVAPSTALRGVYVDTATPSPAALSAALDTFGVERMLFGTDSPPLTGPLAATVDLVARLPLSPPDRQRVFADNARELFGLGPQLADRRGTP